MKKELGGQRLGSGGKMMVHMKNYGRSSHNLGRAWRSSMAPGTLVPFLVEPTLPGDTFEIDLSTLVRTLPTNGPIFGSFKLQLDVFSCPIRLYNAQLHNNELGVGLKMQNVKFPMMELTAKNILDPTKETNGINQQQISQSSLLAYTGVRGLGKNINASPSVTVKKNAMPLLMYWDIYKNYYANKQEEIGFVVKAEPKLEGATLTHAWYYPPESTAKYDILNETEYIVRKGGSINFEGTNLDKNSVYACLSNGDNQFIENLPFDIQYTENKTILYATANQDMSLIAADNPGAALFLANTKIITGETGIKLTKFNLSDIDDMREMILQAPKTSPLILNNETCTGKPAYLATVGYETLNSEIVNYSKYNMAGLGIKTYLSDRFNNWLSTEWIDGADGIASITAVDTSSGSFTMDALNLAQKVYNMLNRIAVSGGSYNDWQEAVWGEQSARIAESPIYMGGLSSEIIFQEVVSTADASAAGQEQPLGTLAGKGRNANEQGGRIKIKTREPSYIMGIVSLTPRIDYSQGNKWFTRIETMDDWHKPELDGIGFQELITDEMAAWDTNVDSAGNVEYKSAGKQPAWIHYMTSVNETYGTFADQNKEMFMTLNRRYEPDDEINIKDLTTYIDPSKYNYAFAVQELKAENFWVQIAADITARRKMSAKIIPNL